jgi:hypothetical protein
VAGDGATALGGVVYSNPVRETDFFQFFFERRSDYSSDLSTELQLLDLRFFFSRP